MSLPFHHQPGAPGQPLPPHLQQNQHHPAGGQSSHSGSSETVLRLDVNIPNQPNLSYEDAANILGQAIRLSSGRPYRHEYIDKPQEGDMHIIFQPVSGLPFPVDGIRYLEQEQRYTINLNEQLTMEITESKYGFVPGANEQGASRVRKKFRFAKGGHPSVWLVHYSRGPTCVIPAQVVNMPVRHYPLTPSSEPAVFVMGEKAGQKVYPPGMQPSHMGHPGQQPMGPPHLHHPHQAQAAAVAAQNAAMNAMNMNGRHRGHPPPGVPSQPKMPIPPHTGQRRPHDEDEDDDLDGLSHRELATHRFTRNHEFLAELFSVDPPVSPPTLSQILPNESKEQLEATLAKLNGEIEALVRKIEDIQKPRQETADVNTIMA